MLCVGDFLSTERNAERCWKRQKIKILPSITPTSLLRVDLTFPDQQYRYVDFQRE